MGKSKSKASVEAVADKNDKVIEHKSKNKEAMKDTTKEETKVEMEEEVAVDWENEEELVWSNQQMLLELLEHNDFFDMVVDMIPQKLYIPGNTGDDYNPRIQRYFKKGVDPDDLLLTKQERKELHREAKRRKLNPNLPSTTTAEIHKRVEERKQAAGAATAEDEEDDDDDDDEEDEEDHMEEEKKKRAVGEHNKPNGNTSNMEKNESKGGYQSRIEELRAKLHAKLAEKRGNRPFDPDQVSKRAARRTDKLRRKEEAAERKKQKAKDARHNNSMPKQQQLVSTKNGNRNHVPDAATDLANLDFGRLAGLNKESSTTGNYMQNNKALANLSKKQSLEKMLATAEAKRQQMEAFKKSSNPEDRKKMEQIQWGEALKEADGTRIKDNPALLKKQLAKKVAKKAKSTKQWKARMETVQSKQDERQAIRTHNLNARKKGGKVAANLSKTKIVTEQDVTGKSPAAAGAGGNAAAAAGASGKKTPRGNRPGFEGRKREFINGASTRKSSGSGKKGKE